MLVMKTLKLHNSLLPKTSVLGGDWPTTRKNGQNIIRWAHLVDLMYSKAKLCFDAAIYTYGDTEEIEFPNTRSNAVTC